MKLHQCLSISVVVLAGSMVLFPATAMAGRNCEEVAADAGRTQKGIRFATQVRESLELSGANVVLVGRVGSDQSARGVRYTHVGYLMREHPAGAWTVVHELNACGSGTSDLFDEGLANFYLDDPFDYETRLVIPSPAVQDKIAGILLGSIKRRLHETTYSSIANPWSARYQNSDGWAVETFAAAVAAPGEIRSREDAQRWLKEKGYQPSKIHIGAGERAGARLFVPNVRFGDHPDSAWQTQTYEVSTGDSVIAFFSKMDSQARVITQRLDSRPVVEKRVVADTPLPPSLPPAVEVKPMAEPVQPLVVAVPPPAPSVPAPAPEIAPVTSGQSRAQVLRSMQGLVVSYACRPQGYLSQCRQMDRAGCEKQVSDAVLRCFATVSDQQLMNGTEQAAMLQMRDVGYCAVESVDAEFSSRVKLSQTAQGQSCASVRGYQ